MPCPFLGGGQEEREWRSTLSQCFVNPRSTGTAIRNSSPLLALRARGTRQSKVDECRRSPPARRQSTPTTVSAERLQVSNDEVQVSVGQAERRHQAADLDLLRIA